MRGEAATLAARIRERLGPPPRLEKPPLVSVVVPNRDGAALLGRLLEGLVERTEYPRLELILVDNGSSDDSLDLIRSAPAPFPISIVANQHNESFSDSCNQGAELAGGELILFLNNDIEPIEPGWLHELIDCLRETGAGAVGGTLITPRQGEGAVSGYAVQTQPPTLDMTTSGEFITVARGARRELLDADFGENLETAIAMGACLLIERELFHELGGFEHGYFYGGEDVDLGLKLRARGSRFLFSGRAVLIHEAGASIDRLLGDGRSLRGRNRRLLEERWGPRVWREHALDRLAGGGLWAPVGRGPLPEAQSRGAALAPGFCVLAEQVGVDEEAAPAELERALARRGHRHLVLREGSADDPRALHYDVAVHLHGPNRHLLRPCQLNVLWIARDEPTGPSSIERRRYDLVVTGNAERPEQLIDAALAHAELLDRPTRIATGPSGDPWATTAQLGS